jgi:hypothetical protein
MVSDNCFSSIGPGFEYIVTPENHGQRPPDWSAGDNFPMADDPGFVTVQSVRSTAGCEGSLQCTVNHPTVESINHMDTRLR